MVGYALFTVMAGELPPRGALAFLALMTAIYASVNLLVIPNIVRERVSSMLARQVDGSVQTDGQWVVPR